MDSFLCVVLLMIFGCSTFTAWTTCLVIRLTSHSDDLASFFLKICGMLTSTVLTTGWFNDSLDPAMRLSAFGIACSQLVARFSGF